MSRPAARASLPRPEPTASPFGSAYLGVLGASAKHLLAGRRCRQRRRGVCRLSRPAQGPPLLAALGERSLRASQGSIKPSASCGEACASASVQTGSNSAGPGAPTPGRERAGRVPGALSHWRCRAPRPRRNRHARWRSLPLPGQAQTTPSCLVSPAKRSAHADRRVGDAGPLHADAGRQRKRRRNGHDEEPEWVKHAMSRFLAERKPKAIEGSPHWDQIEAPRREPSPTLAA